MQDGVFQVLFLSQRDSARSVIAQAILNKIGAGRFKAHSATTHPAPAIETEVLEILRHANFEIGKTKPSTSGTFFTPIPVSSISCSH